MITPRQTRLLRARSLRSFQHAIADVTRTTDPFVARRTTVLVPTRAAAGRLRKTLEELLVERSPAAGVLALPVLQTRDDWYRRLHDGLADAPPLVTPFKLRPGLIPAIIAFHDELLRFRTSVDAFERLTLEELEPSADLDRGARRLIRQTHFLAAAFRRYATRLEMAGRIDEHGLRRLLTAPAAAVPAVETHVVVTVGDRTSDETGLWPADFDLLTRLPALTRVDVVATETRLAAGLGERLSELLPGMTEEVIDEPETPGPVVVAPASSPERPYFLWRDREEELAGVVRTLKSRQPPPDGAVDDGIGVVFQHPLPYLYLARQLFETSGVPYETRDALPLAAEPYAAAVDLVCRYVASGYDDASRDALLGSPHFSFTRDDEPPPAVATRLESELAPLRTPGSASVLLDVFVSFLRRHAAPAGLASPGDQRSSRARAGIWAALDELGRAHRRFDDSETTSDELMATVRRWIESQTFAPRAGAGGVQLVETQSAVYGRFHELFLVGLTEGEWPERPGRNIFYPSSHLIALGWPRERERLRAARARFVDLVRLSSDRVALSTFMLEDDAVVTPSSLLEDVEDGAGVAPGRPRLADGPA